MAYITDAEMVSNARYHQNYANEWARRNNIEERDVHLTQRNYWLWRLRDRGFDIPQHSTAEAISIALDAAVSKIDRTAIYGEQQ